MTLHEPMNLSSLVATHYNYANSMWAYATRPPQLPNQDQKGLSYV
jgi:hypothetical protein